MVWIYGKGPVMNLQLYQMTR